VIGPSLLRNTETPRLFLLPPWVAVPEERRDLTDTPGDWAAPITNRVEHIRLWSAGMEWLIVVKASEASEVLSEVCDVYYAIRYDAFEHGSLRDR
jgi:hypothetical protein